MIEKTITSDRGTVYYWINEEISMKNFAIVFCHGLTADHTLFDKQVEHLADHYKIITLDFPLHGKSRPYIDFSFKNTNQDLLAILKQEEIKEVILVGQSAGGYIAQSFIDEHGDMVKGFIGIGTTPFGKVYYKNSELFWIRHYTSIAKMYPYHLYCKIAAKAITRTNEARKSIYQSLIRLGKKGMLEATEAFYKEFLKVEKELKPLCPVIITYGEYDKTGYVRKYCNEWAKRSGHPLSIISDAAHNANYDNYQEFNKLLATFVQEIVGGNG